MASGEQTSKTESVDRSTGSAGQSTGNLARNGDKGRAISREQRSEAAKRGWVTRKKRKP